MLSVSKLYSKENTEVEIKIWQDYMDLKLREYPESKRFTLAIYVNSNIKFEYMTDSWTDIEALLPCIPNMQGWKNELQSA